MTRSGNYLIIEYSRPLNASDNCDLSIQPNVPFYAIYSIGYVINATGYNYPSTIGYHDYYSIPEKNITFLSGR